MLPPYYGCTSTSSSSHYAGFSSLPGSVGLQTVYQPSVSQNPFTLKFITSRISKCQGCKMLFRSGSSLQPPQDLIVSRLECRPFVAPDGSVKVSSTAKNAHYHLRFECLTKADSSFSPQCLVNQIM